MNHRWLGTYPVSMKVVGGDEITVAPADFVDADMDDVHVKDYLEQGLLLPVANVPKSAPKGGEK